MLKKILNSIVSIVILILVAGCNISAPRPRIGTLPTPPPGPRFVDPENIGRHSYYFNPFEKNGIVYTNQAGHIDLSHVRWNADYTRYLTKKTYKALLKKRKEYSFDVTWEISKHKVRFSYPGNWDYLSKKEKEKIAHEVSFHVGQYIAFNATIWHEILTWFGTHFAGFEPEFNSAFSWEDMYSNLLGVKLGAEATNDPNHGYDTALTLAINRELKKLGVQPKKVAIDAAEKMRDKWFTGVLFVDTLKKNIDIGLDDGYISPVLVPGICDSAEPKLLTVPTLDILSKYGFKMKYQIFPREWEKGKILKIVYPYVSGKIIYPDRHFPIIINYIKKQAVEKYGYDIN